MRTSGRTQNSNHNNAGECQPPGRIKIANALRELLGEKDFNSITTAEISKVSGVNEALIYRYFQDKRGLLHQVLMEHLVRFWDEMQEDMAGVTGALQKLRNLIRNHIRLYDSDRVFSKILLLEARNFPGYFESETYRVVQDYSRFLLGIIEEGVEKGDIRADIPPTAIRQIILGGIEHLCLPGVIFSNAIRVEERADALCAVILDGIRVR
jgi:TetR/AcrR family transcriptional regulator, fatty acid metabolism regulator protein